MSDDFPGFTNSDSLALSYALADLRSAADRIFTCQWVEIEALNPEQREHFEETMRRLAEVQTALQEHRRIIMSERHAA